MLPSSPCDLARLLLCWNCCFQMQLLTSDSIACLQLFGTSRVNTMRGASVAWCFLMGAMLDTLLTYWMPLVTCLTGNCIHTTVQCFVAPLAFLGICFLSSLWIFVIFVSQVMQYPSLALRHVEIAAFHQVSIAQMRWGPYIYSDIKNGWRSVCQTT